MIERSYGWQPSPPDQRDLIFQAAPRTLMALPPRIDLTNPRVPVQSQGRIGSCGPHTATGDLLLEQVQAGVDPLKMPSRLFIYYATRAIMGTLDSDSGVYNRAMLKALATYGWCDESLWPYRVERFTERPPQEAIDQAKTRPIKEYRAVPQNLDTMKACLAGGDAIIFGFTVYESLETPQVDQTGDIPDPQGGERTVGGHDVLIVGYDDATQRFKIKNSWGREWGREGFGTISYRYGTTSSLSSDFWTITNPGIAGATPPVPPPPIPAPADTFRVTLEINPATKTVRQV